MKSLTFAAALQSFVFGKQAPPELEQSLYVSLHSGPPGDDQATNECKYPGYRSMPVPRGEGWRLDGGRATNLRDILFPVCSGVFREQATHFSIGTKEKGSTTLHYGELDEPIDIKRNTRPLLPALTIVVDEKSGALGAKE